MISASWLVYVSLFRKAHVDQSATWLTKSWFAIELSAYRTVFGETIIHYLM